jgi:membrane protein
MVKKTARVFIKAFRQWKSRDPFRESSIIAYSAIFSLPGLLVVVITLMGTVFGEELIDRQFHESVSEALGRNTADQIREMIVVAMRSKESFWASVIGIAAILLGATGAFVQLQKSLNIIWEVKATVRKSGLWAYIRTRLFSFGLVVSIAFLLLISLFITSLLAALSEWMKSHWTISLMWIFNGLNFLVSLLAITVLFAMMFRILPDARIPWKGVWVGALVTACLFVLGKTLLGFYFGTVSPGSGYGAAESVILILLWTSYSSMIVFYGAEFTKVYSDTYIGHIPANDIARKQKNRQV